jgi:hypothetical protein
MYSLVSAPVLGFDLARLQGGPAVADVLLRALALEPADLDVLGAALPADEIRSGLWLEVDAAARQRQSLVSLAGSDADKALALLERAPIGTVDALLNCIRHEILDWTWVEIDGVVRQSEAAARATAVVCDAAVAMYLRDLLAEPTRRRLTAAWVTASRGLPPHEVHLGPQQLAVTGLLERLRTLTSTDVPKLLHAADEIRRDPVAWAPAVHSASWAVHISGRVRAAAAAQLLLVQVIDDGGVPVADRAAGVWSLASGAVQALLVRDLLDIDTTHRLLAAYLAALGPSGLS